MPSPTESESSTDSTAGCSSTSHSCTHDGSHAHAKRRIGPSEKRICCGGGGHGSRPGSSRRRARAVTAFIHVSPARRSSDLGSISQDTRFARFSRLSRHFLRLLFFCGTMLIREGGTVFYFLFRTPFLPSAVGGLGCKLCGAQRNASRSTCAIENSSAQVRVCCLPCSSVLHLYGANRERAEERGGDSDPSCLLPYQPCIIIVIIHFTITNFVITITTTTTTTTEICVLSSPFL